MLRKLRINTRQEGFFFFFQREVIKYEVCIYLLVFLPTSEIPRCNKPILGDALPVPTVVTPVDFAGTADVLGKTTARFSAALTLQAGTAVETVAFTTSCSNTRTHAMLNYNYFKMFIIA